MDTPPSLTAGRRSSLALHVLCRTGCGLAIAAIVAAGCSPADETAVPAVSSAGADPFGAETPGEPAEGNLVEPGSLLAHQRWNVIERVSELEGFGGVHLEPEHGLVFSVTPDAVEQTEQILRELPPDGPWTLREVRWNMRQLERDQKAVHAAEDDLRAAGLVLTGTSISETENMLTVHVEGDRELAREVLAGLLTTDFTVGGPVHVERAPGTID